VAAGILCRQVDTIVDIVLLTSAGLIMAATIVARGRRRGESALKSLDDSLAVFPGSLLVACAAFVRKSPFALSVTIAGIGLIVLRLLFRRRRPS